MASLTNLLKLIKPDKSENYSVDVWNANSDTIDEAVGKRVVKNDDIVPKTATKITYDAKGLVTGGAELDPDDIPNLDISKITGRAPVIYVDGVPIYGSRFVDIDDSGNMVLKTDGSGDWLISVTEDGKVLVTRAVTPIADDLVTNDAETALSAKMGKYLKQLVDTITTAFNTFTARTDNPHNVTKAQVGLSNADNTADVDKNVATAKKLTTARKINGVAFDGSKDITVADSTKIPITQKGTANGVAELDANSKVPSSQLPYYNSSPTIFIDDKPIYPITFADVKDGKAVISDVGNGEYLVACTPDGTVYLRNMTNNVTDPVTGVVYRLDIVNNQPQLTKI